MILLTQKLIHKETQKPISMKLAEKLIKDVKYTTVPNKTAKQQALMIIKLLKQHPEIPMERMPMIIIITFNKDLEDTILQPIKSSIKHQELKEETETQKKVELTIDPSAFHELQIKAEKLGAEKVQIDIVSVNKDAD